MLDIPGHQRFSTFAATVGLFPVLLFDACGLEGVIDHYAFHIALGIELNRSHQHFFQGNFGVFHLLATGLAASPAAGADRLREVFASGAAAERFELPVAICALVWTLVALGRWLEKNPNVSR